MREVLLCAIVILYMLGGCFMVAKVGKFLDKNYKGAPDSENEKEKDEESLRNDL